jgi:uncharacterized membrane protein YeaQ/YmgE (transglycosylase-associated protein family)
MMLIVIWLIIGIAVGAAVTSFRSGAGTNFSMALSIVAGIIGSVIGAYGGEMLGLRLVGEGPDFLISILGAAVGAVIAVLIAHAIRK